MKCLYSARCHWIITWGVAVSGIRKIKRWTYKHWVIVCVCVYVHLCTMFRCSCFLHQQILWKGYSFSFLLSWFFGFCVFVLFCYSNHPEMWEAVAYCGLFCLETGWFPLPPSAGTEGVLYFTQLALWFWFAFSCKPAMLRIYMCIMVMFVCYSWRDASFRVGTRMCSVWLSEVSSPAPPPVPCWASSLALIPFVWFRFYSLCFCHIQELSCLDAMTKI